MFKLLISAYLIIVVPSFTTGLTIEYVINNKYLAGPDGMTDGFFAIAVMISIYLTQQLLATAFVKKLLWT